MLVANQQKLKVRHNMDIEDKRILSLSTGTVKVSGHKLRDL